MISRKYAINLMLWCSCILLCISCATTRQVSGWKDDTYQGKLKRVLVIAVTDAPLMRNFIETEFTDQLREFGVEGFVSNKIISPQKMTDKAAVLAAIKGMGIETVLVIKALDKSSADRYYSSGGMLVISNLDAGWDVIYSESFSTGSQYQHSLDIFMLQTNVYDLQREKLVFSAISKTYVEGSKEREVEPFVKAMVKELARKGLL